MTWRILPFEHDDPDALLTRGSLLFDALASEPVRTLRWYRSTGTGIVLGRGQRRLDIAPADGMRVVTRSSGGGAVLMDAGILSLDVLVPAGDPWLDGDLGAVFSQVGHAWRDALSALGVEGLAVHEGPSTTPKARSERDRLIAAVCYASLGRGEVTVGGRKLVGLAQRRRRHGALVQCGLLRAWNPRPLLAALGADPDDPEILSAAVGLDDVCDSPPDDGQVMQAVQHAFM